MHIIEQPKTFSHSVDNKTFKRLTSKVKKLSEKEKVELRKNLRGEKKILKYFGE
jgi:hypothetical protein